MTFLNGSEKLPIKLLFGAIKKPPEGILRGLILVFIDHYLHPNVYLLLAISIRYLLRGSPIIPEA